MNVHSVSPGLLSCDNSSFPGPGPNEQPIERSQLVSSASKPNLLFVTPWMPRPTGSGPAMRAYYSLQALSRNYQPHVLNVGVYEKGQSAEPPADLRAEWAHIEIPRLDPDRVLGHALYRLLPNTYYARYRAPAEWRFATDHRVALAARVFAGIDFDLIHVFRLYATPYAQPYISASPGIATQLDLDEVESSTRKRIGALCDVNGRRREGRQFRRDAEVYSRIERESLPKWRRVLVASRVEKGRLRSLAPAARCDVLPNVYPAMSFPAKREHNPFRFLFVGQLGYVPNADAVRWFVEEVWPRVRKRTDREVALDVVGAGASRTLAWRLKSTSGVRFWARVETLDRIYSEAGAVIVPLRTGGGTRIKVLEAFARGVPVIATAVGAEGLDVTNGRDLLIADTDEDFADACLRLIAEDDLRETLREHAHRLCRERYGPDAMTRVLNHKPTAIDE